VECPRFHGHWGAKSELWVRRLDPGVEGRLSVVLEPTENWRGRDGRIQDPSLRRLLFSLPEVLSRPLPPAIGQGYLTTRSPLTGARTRREPPKRRALNSD